MAFTLLAFTLLAFTLLAFTLLALTLLALTLLALTLLALTLLALTLLLAIRSLWQLSVFAAPMLQDAVHRFAIVGAIGGDRIVWRLSAIGTYGTTAASGRLLATPLFSARLLTG